MERPEPSPIGHNNGTFKFFDVQCENQHESPRFSSGSSLSSAATYNNPLCSLPITPNTSPQQIAPSPSRFSKAIDIDEDYDID